MDVMTTSEVAELLRTPQATLRYWRHTGTGPRSFKMGPRRVMYRRADVEAWVEAQYAADGSH
ncbi:MAG: helix-turn-helix domain-containing protein [Ornithinimicrobium sp.]